MKDMEDKTFRISGDCTVLEEKCMGLSVAESNRISELCDKIEALGKIVSEVDDTTAESYYVVTRS